MPATAIFGLSLLFVFLVLAALYRSWTLPFSVLLSTPIAVFGAFGTLYLRRLGNDAFETDIYAQIGLVMLIGLAAKNAILIVEFAKAGYDGGMSLREAALAGAKTRLRPILMTSLRLSWAACLYGKRQAPGILAPDHGRYCNRRNGGGQCHRDIHHPGFVLPHRETRRPLAREDRGAGTRRAEDRMSPSGRFAGLAFIPLSMFLSGCVVGPNYSKVKVNAPAVFRGAEATAQQASIADLPWWDVFKDADLKGLIQTSLANNHDLAAVVTRVEQSRQVAAEARSQYFPAISYNTVISAGQNQFTTSPASNGNGVQGFFLGIALATWEPDLWGRIRRMNESAMAQYLATEEGRRGVMLTLVSDVSQAYFELLGLKLQLEIARASAGSYGESLTLFTQRLEGGIVSKLATSRAAAAEATAAANIPEVERLIALKENQISILLGKNPGAIEVKGKTSG